MSEKIKIYEPFEPQKSQEGRSNEQPLKLGEQGLKFAEDVVNLFIEEGDVLGSGQYAAVHADPKKNQSETAIKFFHEPTKQTKATNDAREEIKFQGIAFDTLNEATVPCAKAPCPQFYAQTESGQEFISMEEIHGKTLFRLILEQAVIQTGRKTDLEEINETSDDELERLILGQSSNTKALAKTEKLMKFIKNPSFLPIGLMRQFEEALKLFKSKNLFHGDLHPKNIMISHDLSQMYIIDFGTASFGKRDYTEIQGEKEGFHEYFMPDNQCMGILGSLTQ